jgi:hypothetical protein
MFFGAVRFWSKGWIETLYIEPDHFFYYYGFSWVSYPGDFGIYLLFGIIALSALMVAAGFFYRVAIILFFISFTWVELIDISLYLNHYYFVSLISALMIFLPANGRFSIDSKLFKVKNYWCPRWTLLAPKIFIGALYFFAGIAKINYDWLFEALPLKLWLPANSHLPVIGSLLTKEYTAYLFSWIGMVFDLSVFFFLLYKKTRPYAYFFVVIFHLSTAALFQIGIFPYIMPLLTLIFFSSDFHERILGLFKSERISSWQLTNHSKNYVISKPKVIVLLLVFAFIIIFPMRYIVYPGNLFWHEQGYRFGWRVMLAEKAGYATFYVTTESNKVFEVLPSELLTRNQEKELVTQPDLILQFADIIEEEYSDKYDISTITCECYATMNGGPMKLLIDPDANLLELEDTWSNKKWISDYE